MGRRKKDEMGSTMQELRRLLATEQAPINAELSRRLDDLPPLARPAATHVLEAGGKRLRPLLTLITGRALGCPQALQHDLYILGAAVEMLHAATLLHDDILDNALLRRGKPAAHTLFGTTPVVLAGDALLAKALLMVARLDDVRLTGCISEAVMRTAEGEIAEFASLRDTSMPQSRYLAIITGKTAWMLRASCELGALRAGAAPTLVDAAARFGLELGIAFQMVDDALDFSPSTDTGKPTGGDLREGKITPPLLHYLGSLPPDRAATLRERFAADALEETDLEQLGAEIFHSGCAQKTRAQADAHLASARTALTAFPPSEHRDLLGQMIDYVGSRES